MKITELRSEHQIIAEWITNGSRILDLGCGNGAFLAALQHEKKVTGYGIEIDPDNIVDCISKNVKVIQANLDEGLSGFDANSFDYVVMTQTIQAMRFPHKVINEMLRIGREVIVTFPNLGHWKHRLKLLKGNIPVTAPLPNSWFETPNIHICTIGDFERLCSSLGINILERAILNSTHRPVKTMKLFPNLFGEVAIYRTCKAPYKPNFNLHN